MGGGPVSNHDFIAIDGLCCYVDEAGELINEDDFTLCPEYMDIPGQILFDWFAV